MLPTKKTKIIATIGPASQEIPVLEQLIKNGMNVARINFAHGDYAAHARVIANVRQAAANTGQRVAIMGDLPGPKMRIGELATETVTLERGQPFTLQTEPTIGDQHHASLDFAALATVFKPGDRIYMNDGYIQLAVQRVADHAVYCTVVVGGELRSRKGVNFPGIDLGISAFTDNDHELLRFCAEQQLDAVSQSFVQGPEDISAVRAAATALNYRPFLIAKLERAETVKNLEQILQVVDGIMVARGDLGVEIPIEEVAIVQKQMIRQANRYGKPVITATHMLESMIDNRRPTRAEATDVANAILDGTDCVMLSGETAIGSFPEETVAVMARIAQVAEAQGTVNDAIEALIAAEGVHRDLSLEDRTALGVYHSARELEPAIILTPTDTGATPRRLARFKLPTWIVAFSVRESTCQQLQFSYGVYAEHVAAMPLSWENHARHWCKTHGVTGQLALLTEGTSQIRSGGTTRISILYL
ncbi:MAG: pyruvate kinase [Caldilinea sp. CFX5]|nr:pyruvate kinase [Caldilinea sp. CFX5]